MSLSNRESAMKVTMRRTFGLVFCALLLSASSAFAQGTIRTVAGSTWTFPTSAFGGSAASAPLGYINGVAIDASGNIYASDGGNHFVVKISTSGILTLAAGSGSCCYSGDGGPATLAQLSGPYGLAFDSTGNLYI